MQKSSILELDRIVNELNADIILAEETGIENSEKRETDNYIYWTASDAKAKESKDKDRKFYVANLSSSRSLSETLQRRRCYTH